jgi:phosphoglucomutase
MLHPACNGVAPVMELDSKRYKLVDSLDEAISGGIPSLAQCKHLKVKGNVRMSDKTTFVGEVSIVNGSNEPKFVPTGTVTGLLDLTSQRCNSAVVSTSPLLGEKPRSSGLRKKAEEFIHWWDSYPSLESDKPTV